MYHPKDGVHQPHDKIGFFVGQPYEKAGLLQLLKALETKQDPSRCFVGEHADIQAILARRVNRVLEEEEAKDVRDSSETGAGATHYRVDEDGRIVFNKEGTPILRQLTDEVQQQQWANAGVRWVLLKDGEQPRPMNALDVNVLFDDKVRVYSHTISTDSDKASANKRKPE